MQKSIEIYRALCYNESMAKVTDITAQKKRKDRVNIFLDGTYYCSLDALTVAKHRLAIGDEIDEEGLSEIQLESEQSSAFERAVNYLSYRSRTEKEIEKYLQEKGYLAQTVECVMQKLGEYGFTGDERFCREYVAAYGSRVGKIKIKADLMRLGARQEAIDEALAELEEQEDAAYSAAEKYLRTHKNADILKLKRHLYSKGFDYDDISSAVDRIKDEYFQGEDEQW